MAKKTNLISELSNFLNEDTPRGNQLTRLRNTSELPAHVPLQIDVEKYMQFAPTKQIAAYADSKYIQDVGANYQGNLRRNLSFFPRMATTALFEASRFATTPIDFLAGLVFNNDPYSKGQNIGNLTHSLRETEKRVNETFFPILHRSDYADKSFLQQIGSSEFIGEEFAQGAGFFAGMLIPGAAMSKLGGFRALSRGIMKANRYGVETALKSPFWKKTTNLAQRQAKANRLMLTEGTADNLSLHSFTAAQTMVEASAEASFAKEEAYNTLMEKVQNGEINPATGMPWTRDDVEKGVASIGKGIYWYNMAVLGISNTIMNNMLFGARKLKGRELSEAAKKHKSLKDAGSFRRAYEKGKKLVSATGKGVLTEGFWEEGSQTAGEMAARAMLLEGEDPSAYNILSSFVKNYEEMLTTKEGAKSIFIGSVLGAGPSAFQRAGEIKRAETVYDLLNESRNNLINVYLKPLTGDIYERDEKGELILNEEGTDYVMRVAGILQDAQQQFGIQLTALEMQKLASENPKEFAKVVKEQIVPQLIKNYVRFDATLEMLEEDLVNELKPIRDQNPDFDYLISIDEITEIGRQMMKDRKRIQAIADNYVFSPEAMSDLQSGDKKREIKVEEFKEEVIFDEYLNVTTQIRNVKQKLEEVLTEEETKKLEEDLKTLESNKLLLEAMTQDQFNELYKAWNKNRNVRIQNLEKAAAAIAEVESGVYDHLSKEAQEFWMDHHLIEVDPTEKSEGHVATAEFSLVDNNGNVVDSNVRLVNPDRNQTLGGKNQGLKLKSANNEYLLTFDESGNPVITHTNGSNPGLAFDQQISDSISGKKAKEHYAKGVETFDISQQSIDELQEKIDSLNNSPQNKAIKKALQAIQGQISEKLKTAGLKFSGMKQLEGFDFSVTRTHEDVAKANRKNVATATIRGMAESFADYLEKVKKNQAEPLAGKTEELLNKLLTDIEKRIDSLDEVPAGLFYDFLSEILDFSDELANYQQKLSETADAFAKASFALINSSTASAAEKAEMIRQVTNGSIGFKELNDFVQANKNPKATKTDDLLKNAEKLYEEFESAQNSVQDPEVLATVKNLFKVFAAEVFNSLEGTYGAFDQDAIMQIALGKEQLEDIAAFFGSLADPTAFLEEKTDEEIIGEGIGLSQEQRSRSDSPTIGAPGTFQSIIRPGLDEVSNEKVLSWYESRTDLSDNEKAHKRVLEMARRYHRLMRFFNGAPFNPGDTMMLIGVETIINGSLEAKIGKKDADIIRKTVLFFAGYDSESVPKYRTIDNMSQSELESAKGDFKIVFAGLSGNKLTLNEVDPKDNGDIEISEIADTKNPLLYVSILSSRDIDSKAAPGAPSFLFKRLPTGEIKPRYRNLDLSDVPQYMEDYQKILDAAKEGPVQRNPYGMSPTLGSMNDEARVAYSDILAQGTLISEFIKNNPLFPARTQDMSFYQMMQEGFFILSDRLGQNRTRDIAGLNPGFHYMRIQGLTTVLATKRLDDDVIKNFIDFLKWTAANYKTADYSDIDRIIDHFKTKFHIKTYDQVVTGANLADPAKKELFIGKLSGSGVYTIAFTDANGVYHEHSISQELLESAEFVNQLSKTLSERSYSTLYAEVGATMTFYESVDFSQAQPTFKDEHDYQEYINRMASKLLTIFKKPSFTQEDLNSGKSVPDYTSSIIGWNTSAQFTPVMSNNQNNSTRSEKQNPMDPSGVANQPSSSSKVEKSPIDISEQEASALADQIVTEDFIDGVQVDDDIQDVTLPEEYKSAYGTGNILAGSVLKATVKAFIESAAFETGYANAPNKDAYLEEVIKSLVSKKIQEQFRKTGDGPSLNLNPFANHGGVMTRVLPKAKTPVAVDHVMMWFMKHHPDAEVTITDDPNHLGQLSQGGDIIFSRREPDALYHEAWHRTSMYFLSPEQRTEVYEEVRERLGETVVPVSSPKGVIYVKGSEMTDNQAEEYLADEFRKYMLYGKDYKFPPKAKKQTTLFERIIDFFKSLIGFFTGEPTPTMEHLFLYAKYGKFQDSAVTSHQGEFNMLPSMGSEETLITISEFDTLFTDHIWSMEQLMSTSGILENSLNNNKFVVDDFWTTVLGDSSHPGHAYTVNKVQEINTRLEENNDAVFLAIKQALEAQGITDENQLKKMLFDETLSRIQKEFTEYLNRKGYGVREVKLEDELVQQRLEQREEFYEELGLSDSDPEQSSKADDDVNESGLLNTASWNRSKNVAKTTPTFVKAFFEGLVDLNELRDLPRGVEMQSMFIMKVVVQNAVGQPFEEIVNVLRDLANRDSLYSKVLARWQTLLDARAQGSAAAAVISNQIYRAINITGQEFMTAAPGKMNKKMAEKSILDNKRGFEAHLLQSRFFGSKGRGGGYIQMTGENGLDQQLIMLRNAGVTGSLNILEDLFGPILRKDSRKPINEIAFGLPIGTLKNLLLKAFEDYEAVEGATEGLINVDKLKHTMRWQQFLERAAYLKYVYMDRAGDMSIPNLKGVNQKTRKYAMGENTHLTYILNDINGIKFFLNLKRQTASGEAFKNAATRHYNDVMVKHGFAKRVFGGKIQFHENVRNSFLIKAIDTIVTKYISDISQGRMTDFEITETVLMGFEDRSIGESKDVSSMSSHELISAHIKALMLGEMPMIGTGARERESLISFRNGDRGMRTYIPTSSVFTQTFMQFIDRSNDDVYIDAEEHLLNLFTSETANVLMHRFMVDNSDRLPSSFKKNVNGFKEKGLFNYMNFDDVYQKLQTKLNDALNQKLEEMSSNPKKASFVYKLAEEIVNQHKDSIQTAIKQVTNERAQNLLDGGLPTNSYSSPYSTNMVQLLATPVNGVSKAVAPDWVIIAPFRNVVVDHSYTFADTINTTATGASVEVHKINDVNDPIFQYSPSDPNYSPYYTGNADMYVINGKLFGFSPQEFQDFQERSPFLNHVAKKYGWPNNRVKDISNTLLITRDEALQIMREVQLLYRISATEGMMLTMGNTSMFKGLDAVTRRLEMIGSTKSRNNGDFVFDGINQYRFDLAMGEKVSKANTARVRVLPDIEGFTTDENGKKVSAFSNLRGEGLKNLIKRFRQNITLEQDKQRIAHLEEVIKKAEKILESDFEGTDALSLVSLDYYRELLYKDGSWLTDEFERMYVAQMYFLTNEAIKINNEVEDEAQKLKLNGKVVDETIWKNHPLFIKHGIPFEENGLFVPSYEGNPVNLKTTHKFKSLKPQGTGVKTIQGQPFFTMAKTAYTPLIPSEHIGNPEMIRFIWENTVQDNIDVIAYESSLKGSLPLGDNSVDTTNHGLQFREPWSKRTGATISKQLLALTGMDLHQLDSFANDAQKNLFEKLDSLFNKDVSDLVMNYVADYFASVGLAIDFKNSTVKIARKDVFIEEMIKKSKVGVVDSGSIKQLESFLERKKGDQYLDTLISGELFKNVIMSSIERNVMSLTDSSAQMYVQEADTTGNLKFWRFENNKIMAPQIKMPIPQSLEPWILRTFGLPANELSDPSKYEYNYQLAYTQFREAFRNNDPRIPKQLRQAIINRTPMDNRHSATAVEIADVLLPWEGSKVVVPMELVFIYGFDFDFDKMTTYVQTPTFDKVTGKLVFPERSETFDDIIDKVQSEIANGKKTTYAKLQFYLRSIDKTAARTLDKALKKLLQSGGRNIQAQIDVLQKELLEAEVNKEKFEKKGPAYKSFVEKSVAKIASHQEKISVLQLEMAVYGSKDPAFREALEDAIKVIMADRSVDPTIFDDRKAILNRIYDSMHQMMMMDPAVMFSMIPTETENITDISLSAIQNSVLTKEEQASIPKKDRLDAVSRKILGKWSDLYDIGTNAERRSIILSSGRGIGIFASSIPMFARLQRNPIRMTSMYRLPVEGFNTGVPILGQMYDKSGGVVSMHNSEFINIFLDVTRQLGPFFAGVSELVAPIIEFMMISGTEKAGNIDPKLILNVLNQPIIKTFLTKYKSNLKNLSKYGSKNKAKADAFAYAAAIHNIDPLLYNNPEYSPLQIEAYDAQFAQLPEKQRINDAKLKLNSRNQGMFPGSIKDPRQPKHTPLLYQMVQSSFYSNNGADLSQLPAMFGMSTINERDLEKIQKAYRDNSINYEVRRSEFAMLDAFATMMTYSDQFTRFAIPFRRDSQMPKTLHQLEANEETRSKFLSADPMDMTTSLFERSDIENFYEGNYLKSFIQVNNITLNFLKERTLFYGLFDKKELKYFFNQLSFQTKYDRIKEYFPSYLVQRYTPEIDEEARTLLFSDGMYNDSLQGLYRQFYAALQEEYELNPELRSQNFEDDIIIRNVYVQGTTFDQQFKKARNYQQVRLRNERIQGWDLDVLQERISNITDPNATQNQKLVQAAKAFFDAASIAMIYQSANNRFRGVGKLLVNYDTYNRLTDTAARKFRKDIDLMNTSQKREFLKHFAESIAIANADNPEVISGRANIEAMGSIQQQAKLLPVMLDYYMGELQEDEQDYYNPDAGYQDVDDIDNEQYDHYLPDADETFYPNQQDSFVRIQPQNEDFGDNYVSIKVGFFSDPERLVRTQGGRIAEKAPILTSIDLLYARRKVRDGYALSYVGGTPIEGFYSIRPNEFMDRSVLLEQEMIQTGLKMNLIVDRSEEGFDRSGYYERVEIENRFNERTRALFEDKALYQDRTRMKFAVKAALQMTLGSQLANRLIKSIPHDSLVQGLKEIFAVASGQMEVPSNSTSPMINILKKIAKIEGNINHQELWGDYAHMFAPQEGTPGFKAREVFNAGLTEVLNQGRIGIEPTFEIKENNAEELNKEGSPQLDMFTQTPTSPLFNKDESDMVKNAFANFEEFFGEEVKFSNDLEKLAFLRMVDKGVISIKCTF